ncbi:unnamed protein product [Prorocentrum cordatum]|uniref:Uncharacterized protein n=1 Tax=Prorocentrum cordatum TaxID=2364126 RepID=A0ABN9WFV2_9DINO|nr:unnamed protein product [Polarella glacialis]
MPPGHAIFAFAQGDLVQYFKLAAVGAGLDCLGPELYMLTHGGPSHDHARLLRSLQEIRAPVPEGGAHRWAASEAAGRGPLAGDQSRAGRARGPRDAFARTPASRGASRRSFWS